MNIDELTLGQIKEIQKLVGAGTGHPAAVGADIRQLVGRNVIVRTVTMIYTGKLVSAGTDHLELMECSWIPETERYMSFVSEGKVKKCEPYPADLPVFINRGALLDLCELRAELPRIQK